MTELPVGISIIVPTLNEAENIPILVQQIAGVLAGRSYEILLVDDNSRDNTQQVCAELAKTYPLRLIVREHPKDGLGGAVLHGISQARGEYLVVMDADLQHPPQKLPELLAPLENDQVDFVLGSRLVPGGSVGEKWGLFRKINSSVATVLARPFAGATRDPMSGFFALRRQTFDRAQRLTPLGYKIGLELMCKCRVKNVREIPIHFAERTRGQSKLTLREQFRYLEHLSRLYDFCYPRLSPVAKFLIVTTLSWLVGLGIFMIALLADIPPAVSPVIAYLGAIFVTAVFHRRYIRTQREFLLTKHPWREFLMISLAEIAVCAAVAIWIVHRLRQPSALEIFVLCFGAATVTRYVLRKELMQDIRGLRHDLRKDELA
ncbi:MAG TPA: glycosyltransferase [Tepidisphaeraceae bacterium]|nr:glycosyltransferase [Tepidisphaeraceae bacterium]